MAGIQQEPAFDTSVETFIPFRSSPVYRRVERKYHSQENLNGTSNFSSMTFKIHQPNERLVINECRLVMPLTVRALDGKGAPMSMEVNNGSAACNIAVSENPFSAFRVIDTAINGKVYTEEPRNYGNVLSKCYSSVSEMSFQNNHSLKPVANTNRTNSFETYHRLPLYDGNGEVQREYVESFSMAVDRSSFVAEQLNSGFLERSRRWQDDLVEMGKRWTGDISTLLNTALWSSESRGQSNVQVPYVEDLFMRFVWNTQQCMLDRLYGPVPAGDMKRIVPQGLFEFLTPLNEASFGQDTVPNRNFPIEYEISFTGDPYLQIEWVEYQEMLPIYRLRGYRYQLVKSPEISLPMPQSRDDITFSPVSVMQQCLAVPNKIYCWGELSESSARNAFAWGGVFRTTDMRNINVRVNGHAHIIQDPDCQSMMYKWFKRLTNSTHEWPVYAKQKVFVFSPTEVGINEWLENDAVLSVLDISCEIGLSGLQQPEYRRIDDNDAIHQAGYSKIYTNWQDNRTFRANNYDNRVVLTHSALLQKDPRWPRPDADTICLVADTTRTSSDVLGHVERYVPVPPLMETAYQWLRNVKVRCSTAVVSTEIVSVRDVTRCLVRITNAVWCRINAASGLPVGDKFFFVPESLLFEYKNDANETNGPQFCPYSVWTYDANALDAKFSLAPNITANNVFEYVITAQAFAEAQPQTPIFDWNAERPVLHSSHDACLPSYDAYGIKLGLKSDNSCGVLKDAGYLEPGTSEYPGAGNADNTRWICMTLPLNVDSDYIWTQYHWNDFGSWTPLGHSHTHAHMVCNVERGALGTEPKEYDARNKTYVSHDVIQPDVSPNLKYELNVLLEYSNSQVLMSKTRDIPIEVSNLVPVSR